MRISELLARDKITVSCEIFPPKKDGAFGRIFEVVDQINQLNVDFISVTYGAGGSTSKYNGPRNPDHIFQNHREHGMIKKTQRRDKP